MIVAPYNLQVNLLKQLLPQGAQVGTVDKFQGQEAAVVIVSMTTSKGVEAPRGTEFLFNPNRFNVAVSRAQCLARRRSWRRASGRRVDEDRRPSPPESVCPRRVRRAAPALSLLLLSWKIC